MLLENDLTEDKTNQIKNRNHLIEMNFFLKKFLS